ncbi:hypothetical protein BDK51DRAFT_40507 [Blyttiomyces helicus]|uniref:Oxidoreductase n=1 Tax=Blyttiomyces helicus TaxID=388810 RepID=A0A4P9W7I5_9FUNG|nr:hypothetical protein BDK51DRAFT_40507 [Blyttiomyces helicus]|eukprot:RKO88429.1 hypothetical protein BDK51DRAFT_40507 [Blyttiomyces helicus]
MDRLSQSLSSAKRGVMGRQATVSENGSCSRIASLRDAKVIVDFQLVARSSFPSLTLALLLEPSRSAQKNRRSRPNTLPCRCSYFLAAGSSSLLSSTRCSSVLHYLPSATLALASNNQPGSLLPVGPTLSRFVATDAPSGLAKLTTFLRPLPTSPPPALFDTSSQRKYAGVEVEPLQLDVTNHTAVFASIKEVSTRLEGLDVVVMNAGIESGPHLVGSERTFTQHARCIETNLIGAIAVINAAVEAFRESGRGGQIVGISSVAAWRGLPIVAGYAASKAGLDIYLDSLRAETCNENIKVTTIHPGFIRTAMTDRVKGQKPFMIDAKPAAESILAAIENGARQAFVPWWPWTQLAPILTVIPYSLAAKIRPPTPPKKAKL